MGTVRIRAEAGIARLMPGQKGDMTAEILLGEKVSDVLGRLGIPAQAVALVLVNDRVAAPETALEHGDVLVLLPLIAGG